MRTFSVFLTVLGLAMIVFDEYYICGHSILGRLGLDAWVIGLISWVLSYTKFAANVKIKGKKRK